MQGQLLDLPRPREPARGRAAPDRAPARAHATPVAPSAELVLWSRLGSSVRPRRAGRRDRAAGPDRAPGLPAPGRGPRALPRRDGASGRGCRRASSGRTTTRRWVEANDDCRRDILERLRPDGPLPSTELPDTCEVPWRSSGWNNNRNVRMLLKLMVARGEVAAAGQAGARAALGPRRAGLPRRPGARRRTRPCGSATSAGCAPSASPAPAAPSMPGRADPRRPRPGRRRSSRGCAGSGGSSPSLLDRPFSRRAALLSPFDRLVYDRKRMAELFEFDYLLEMYKPVAKRRWGYYALPILYGDRLVGKLDATADRDEGVLRVDAVHREPAWEHGFDDGDRRRRTRRDRGPRPLAPHRADVARRLGVSGLYPRWGNRDAGRMDGSRFVARSPQHVDPAGRSHARVAPAPGAGGRPRPARTGPDRDVRGRAVDDHHDRGFRAGLQR